MIIEKNGKSLTFGQLPCGAVFGVGDAVHMKLLPKEGYINSVNLRNGNPFRCNEEMPVIHYADAKLTV